MKNWGINLLILQIVLLFFLIPIKSEAQHWLLLYEHLGNYYDIKADTHVSSAARGLLVANGLLVYNEPYLEPDLTKSYDARIPNKNTVRPTESFLKVYPNPARDFITIEYSTSHDKANIKIELFDESGKKVFKQNLIRQRDEIILDTRNFKTGNYIVKLAVDNKTANSAKVVIVR